MKPVFMDKAPPIGSALSKKMKWLSKNRIDLKKKLIYAGGGYLAVLLALVLILTPWFWLSALSSYPESWRLFDRHGELLREVVNSRGERALWTEIEAISPFVIQATIAAEDENFNTHWGVDLLAMMRALLQNLQSGRQVSGASTISMQLARIINHHSHDVLGKALQVYDAFRLELLFSKKAILENYLNRAPYGAGAIGIEAASFRFFDKPSQHLSLAEAALLASLPQSPTRLNPLIKPEAAKERQGYVLNRMLEVGAISQNQWEQALEEPVVFADKQQQLNSMHFTDFILGQVEKSGDVYTTLDKYLNQQIENIISDHVMSLSSGGITNAAALVLDNQKGDILAMVGSAGYWDSASGSVNGVQSLRQPGSALKPFTYALSFEQGFTPASCIPDIETKYYGADDSFYIPQNYSNQFHGPVLLYEALARSINVPAVRVLREVGVNKLLRFLKQAGITSLNKSADYYGLGLTLGNGEVTMLELAQAYALFPRKGYPLRIKFLRDQNREGAENSPLLSEQICFLISDILSNEQLRVQAYGPANPLLLGFPMAIKTGTSSNWRDIWVVGYTEKYTIAVWAGDFEGNPMNQLSGAIGAGPLFHKIARLVVLGQDENDYPEALYPPDGVEKVQVCALSGLIPTENCPVKQGVFMLSENKPLTACYYHQRKKIDKRNGLLASDKCPNPFVEEKVFEVLPSLYAKWQATKGIQPPPTEYSPFCPEEGKALNAIVITHPRNNDLFILEPGYNRDFQTIEFSVEVDPPVSSIDWYLDNALVAQSVWPYSYNWPIQQGQHRLQARGGTIHSDIVEFEIK